MGLISQMQRAAFAVPANIAEGAGTGQTGQYQRYISIARGSVAELETHILVAQRLGMVTQQHCQTAWDMIQGVGKMLTSRHRALAKRST